MLLYMYIYIYAAYKVCYGGEQVFTESSPMNQPPSTSAPIKKPVFE